MPDTKLCPVCGNEVDISATICRYCDAPLEPMFPAQQRVERIVLGVVILKDGNPTVPEALASLDVELAKARKSGLRILKVIHGYGSSGQGGAIKIAVQSHLKQLLEAGQIRRFLTGVEHFEFSGKRNFLLNKYPELRETWISDRGNPGITFIEL